MKTTAFVAIACLAACTSKSPKRPDQLGGCISTSDAAVCGNPAGGGGIAGGGGGTGSDAGNPATADASASGTADTGVCGTADSLVNTANLTCQPCIVMNCCLADQACTGACESLLQCAQSCSMTVPRCVSDCETTWSAGLTAYQDLAQCMSLSCSPPQCPRLPQ